MTKEEFIKEIGKLNINITPDILANLEKYKNLLLEYNQKFNLTAIKTDEEIYLKHFYDSLTLINAVNLNENLKLLDIGTGAGFPGLVLKIFFPNLDITLLEASHKKVSFLETVIKELNLQKITCINKRAEDITEQYRESFDIVTSRAVASLPILCELAIPYLKVAGLFVAMKGECNTEIEKSSKILEILNSKIVDTIEFNLPNYSGHRSLVIIKKFEKTNIKYPRRYDKIMKSN